jgi:hypothetical protein
LKLERRRSQNSEHLVFFYPIHGNPPALIQPLLHLGLWHNNAFCGRSFTACTNPGPHAQQTRVRMVFLSARCQRNDKVTAGVSERPLSTPHSNSHMLRLKHPCRPCPLSHHWYNTPPSCQSWHSRLGTPWPWHLSCPRLACTRNVSDL